MFYPSDSKVKTLPLSGERVKHSSEGCFSGSPKIFQAKGYFFFSEVAYVPNNKPNLKIPGKFNDIEILFDSKI